MLKLSFETVLTTPAATVFAYFANPANIPAVYGNRALRLLHHDGCVRPGATTWIEATVFGMLPIVMGFEHVLYEPPRIFAERMIHGPFARFEHRHVFDESQSGTIVRDEIALEVPKHYGGRPATQLVAGLVIRPVFRDRARTLARLDQAGKLDAEGVDA